MRILLIPDVLDWAIDFRCQAIQKFIPEHEFVRRAGDRNPEVLADNNKFDVIHFNYTYGLTDYYNFLIANKDRVVITLANERSILYGTGVQKEKLAELVRVLPNVTTVSLALSRLYNIKYIPNGIDEDLFNKKKNLVVGYAGSLAPLKNVDLIKQACKELKAELKIADYTKREKFILSVPHNEMQNFYMGIDVYVHTSKTEGFSNTILEALSCNVPVIMTRQGVWQELEDYVTFIEPTVESIKHSLRRYLGRELVEKKFLWKNIVPEYKKVYEEIWKKSQ